MSFNQYTFLFIIIFYQNAFGVENDFFNKVDKNFQKIETGANLFISKNIGEPQKVEEFVKYLEQGIKQSRKNGELMLEEDVTVQMVGCKHCPNYMHLTGSINKVLQKMKSDPSITNAEDIPVDINRLNLLFYTVKVRLENGDYRCDRYMDQSKDLLKQTTLPGQLDLVANDVFHFPAVAQFQIIDPQKEEVVYYYRGTGDQRNIIVQAILTKEGGKFRYYYYRPTQEELNPYNLPALSSTDLETASDVTVKKNKLTPAITPPTTGVVENNDPNKFSLVIDPKLETHLKVIPKNVHLAKGEISQEVLGTGIRVNGNTAVSLKGNQAQLNLQNEKGYSFINVDVSTDLKGVSKHRVEVPYEVILGNSENEDAIKAKGRLEDNSTHTMMSLSLTDKGTQYLRTEVIHSKETRVTGMTVAKDFLIGKSEMITVALGRNEEKKNYTSLQHRKAIKDNFTMVLDVRIDQDKKASFVYQLKALF